MDQKLIVQMRLLKESVELLRGIANQGRDAYLGDRILQSAVERNLQMAVESCINIGNRILSMEQFSASFKAPETYAGIFNTLAEIKVIEPVMAGKLQDMAKFRNKLVHVYWELDQTKIFEIIHSKLDDFEEFLGIVKEYLKDK